MPADALAAALPSSESVAPALVAATPVRALESIAGAFVSVPAPDAIASAQPPIAPLAQPRSSRLPGLDGLRAIAVLAVIGYHADLGWLPGGYLGVEVFFVISGYLITALLLAERRKTGRIDVRAFWMRRARRLLPALFLLLSVCLAFAVVFLPDEVARMRGDALAAAGYVMNWYLVLRNQSYFEAMGRPAPLGHLWSLAVEEQFYLFWPLVLAGGLALLRPRRMAMLILAGAAGSAVLMAILYQPGADPSRVYYGTDTRLTGLLLGAALAFAWVPRGGATASAWAGTSDGAVAGQGAGASERAVAGRGSGASGGAGTGAGDVPGAGSDDAPGVSRRPFGRLLEHARWDLVGIAGLAALGASFVLLDEYEPFLYRGGFAAVGLVTALVIAAVVHPSARLGKRVLDRQPLRWIGERSYGIYLWHWPIFTITRPGLDVPLDALPDLALRLAATFAIAELSYRFVETPIRRGALGSAWHRWGAAQGRRVSLYGWRLAAGGAMAVLALVIGAQVAVATPPAPPAYLALAPVRDEVPGSPSAGSPGGAGGGIGGSVGASVGAGIDTGLAGGGGSPAPAGGSPASEGRSPAPAGASPAPAVGSPAPGSAASPSSASSVAGTPGAASGASGPGSASALESTAPVSVAPSPSGTMPAHPRVFALGDSVMLGAVPALRKAIPGIRIDAVEGRAFAAGLAVLQGLHAAPRMPDIVIVALGDNGWITTDQVDQAMHALQGVRLVAFVNLREPRSWEGHDNQVLAAAATRYANVVLVDWHAASADRPDLFWADGIHLRPEGAAVYAQVLASSIP